MILVLIAIFSLQEPTSKNCKQTSAAIDQNCLEEKLRRTVSKGKVVEALDQVAEYYNDFPSPDECHALTHIIGEETYELSAKGRDFALSPKSAYCAYGFYHGFLERLVQRTGDLKQAGKFCNLVDSKLGQFSKDAKLQCYHGIGHGTATFHETGNIRSEEDILKPALKLCENVSDNFDQLYRCASGAFNALALYYISRKYNLPLDTKDPLRVCRQVEDKFKGSCYGNMNVLLYWLTEDLKAGSSYIEDIAEDKFAVLAARYYSAVVSSMKKNPSDNLVLICRSLQERLRKSCVEGIVHGLIEHGTPGLEYVDSIKFCSSSILTEEEKTACFREAIVFFHSIYPKEKVKDICTDIEEKYFEFCKKIQYRGSPIKLDSF